jgi:hypothetical protein
MCRNSAEQQDAQCATTVDNETKEDKQGLTTCDWRVTQKNDGHVFESAVSVHGVKSCQSYNCQSIGNVRQCQGLIG